jgi:uncharacterized protein (UPF0305 family)
MKYYVLKEDDATKGKVQLMSAELSVIEATLNRVKKDLEEVKNKFGMNEEVSYLLSNIDILLEDVNNISKKELDQYTELVNSTMIEGTMSLLDVMKETKDKSILDTIFSVRKDLEKLSRKVSDQETKQNILDKIEKAVNRIVNQVKRYIPKEEEQDIIDYDEQIESVDPTTGEIINSSLRDLGLTEKKKYYKLKK